MGALTYLDSDRARLCAGRVQAERDIVQFVRKYLFHRLRFPLIKFSCHVTTFFKGLSVDN